jgi:nitrogen fixation protein FixH
MAEREPWPWIVAGGLAAMIAVSLALARTALEHPDPLVTEDVYAAGLAWNQRQRGLALAEAAGWQLELVATPERDGVRVALAATDAAGRRLRRAHLSVRRVRPSEGGYDADIPLASDGSALVPLPRPGRWLLVASAERDGALAERVYRVQR